MKEESRAGVPRVVFSIVFTVLVYGAHIYMREGLDLLPGDARRLLVTGILVVSFSWLIWEYVRLSRSLDEYHRQVQYLALAIAYPCSLVLTFAVGFFRAEGMLAGADPRDLPILLLFSGALGYFIAWKRYS